MDAKFGVNVSNKTLLNAAKFQGYSFYRFWVIKEKPTGMEGELGAIAIHILPIISSRKSNQTMKFDQVA